MASNYIEIPLPAGSGGVTSLNTLTGALTLAAGTGISVTPSGSTLTIAATGGGDVTLAAFGSTPNANGASLTSQVLNLQPASGSFPGGVSTTTQSFAGDKTFNGVIGSNGGFSSLKMGTATGGANFSSNAFNLYGSYWNGSAAADDIWGMQIVLGAGTNPYSILNFTHAGSPGLQTVYMPALDNTPIGLINASPIGTNVIYNSSAQTTLTGSAGTAICTQPEQGASHKKAAVYLSGYTDTGTQTYTFPTAFNHTPYVYGLTAGVAGATVTTTSIKFTVTTLTGFVFVEGF